MENWIDIEGFDGRYSISNFGRVRSNARTCPSGNGRVRRVRDRIMSPVVDKGGYLRVGLNTGGRPRIFAVHRLVAFAFLPNNKNYPEVNHIDNNPANNNADNLEWCDRVMNVNHSLKQGRMFILPSQAPLSSDKLARIKDLQSQGISQREIARILKVGSATIRKYT